ncbi:hypothetical protein BBP40_011919 [Aspergillus hancockii]|nr:hypothetical protein BBP40_011919 [Aspergillus hancockii]
MTLPPSVLAVVGDIVGGGSGGRLCDVVSPSMIVYGMTEMMCVGVTSNWQTDEDVPPDCCGWPSLDMELKLNGEGVLCVRSPTCFNWCLSENPAAMSGVFDADGYW